MPRFLFTLLVLNLSSIKTGSTSPGHFDHAVMALVETPNRDAKGTPCRHRVGRSWSVEQGDMEEVYMNIGRNVTTNQPFWTTRPKKTMHMCVYYICILEHVFPRCETCLELSHWWQTQVQKFEAIPICRMVQEKTCRRNWCLLSMQPIQLQSLRCQRIGLRENLQETMYFTMKYGGVLLNVP